MDDDIVARMRKHASLSGLHTFEGTKDERKAEFNRMRSVANNPSSEIVARLRAMAWLAQCSDSKQSHLVQAADEIERLRRNTGCARDQRSTQFCAEALDAQREIERLREERDEARRAIITLLAGTDIPTMHRLADERGWTCFHDNAARRSTAPTPANTGGGADHQIPEAL